MQEFNYTLIANIYCPGKAVAPGLHADAVDLQESLVIQDSDISYYRRLRLAATAEGKLAPIEKLDKKLAQLHSVELKADPLRPELLQVACSGVYSRSGVALDVPLITREGQEFSVLLAELTGSTELTMPGNDPYQIRVALDISGLDSGNYLVRVNGIERRFSVVD